MSGDKPQRSKTFSIVSGFVVVGSLYLLAGCSAAIFQDTNPFAMMGGILAVPILLALAIQQYRGTFRHVPSAARGSSVILIVMGAFWAFGAVTTFCEIAIDSELFHWSSVFLLGPMILIATALLLVGKLNANWARALRTSSISEAPKLTQARFSLREFLLLTAAVGATIGYSLHLIRSELPPFAEHVEASAAPFRLPDGATDVCYARDFNGLRFECTTDETAFRKWVQGIGSFESQAAGVELSEISTPIEVRRYTVFLPTPSGPESATVSNGLSYAWSKEDRGVYATFDRTNGRTYYYSHSR